MQLARITAGALAAFASGCGPQINSFAVTPARACAGDTVTVVYSARGTATLRVTPRRVGAGTDTTRYELVVIKGRKVTHAAQDVLTYRGAAGDTLVLGPTRRLGGDSVEVAESLGSDDWPDFVVIGELWSASGRPIVAAHAGQVAVLGADAGSTAFDGAPVAGDWDLRAPLLSDERFATPGHSPPDRLRLGVTVRCRPDSGDGR